MSKEELESERAIRSMLYDELLKWTKQAKEQQGDIWSMRTELTTLKEIKWKYDRHMPFCNKYKWELREQLEAERATIRALSDDNGRLSAELAARKTQSDSALGPDAPWAHRIGDTVLVRCTLVGGTPFGQLPFQVKLAGQLVWVSAVERAP